MSKQHAVLHRTVYGHGPPASTAGSARIMGLPVQRKRLTNTTQERTGARRGRWIGSWHDLVKQVLDPGLCTGCAGCVLACPRSVLALDQTTWLPRLSPDAANGGPLDTCVHAERGCTMCTRACPRFGAWETDADQAVRGRTRDRSEVTGIYREALLVSSTDTAIAAAGQDGGAATAMLAYALEHDIIDAALVSYTDPGQQTRPGLARTREDLIAAAGSRYTYSPTSLLLSDALEAGATRLGMVSVPCQTAIPAVCEGRGARKLARRFALTIGLLCCETYDEAIYDDLVYAEYGVERAAITKADIKGKLLLWTAEDGGKADVEIPLTECAPYRRSGCAHCPDFTAQHADISLGGIGKHPNATVAFVRSELASQLVRAMEKDGWITVRDAVTDDPAALRLITRLAAKQRQRWTASPAASQSHPEPGLLPHPDR